MSVSLIGKNEILLDDLDGTVTITCVNSGASAEEWNEAPRVAIEGDEVRGLYELLAAHLTGREPNWKAYREISRLAYEKNGYANPAAQVMCLAEEVGEFVKEARRELGLARAPGNRENLCAELADVIISANVVAWTFDIDLAGEVDLKLRKIKERGGL